MVKSQKKWGFSHPESSKIIQNQHLGNLLFFKGDSRPLMGKEHHIETEMLQPQQRGSEDSAH